MTARNREGQQESLKVEYLFASSPGKPGNPPTLVEYNSTNAIVEFGYSDSNQGSGILSYSLQVRDDITSRWTTLAGDHVDSLVTIINIELIKGIAYELRFRVKNVYGWSEFSDIERFVAADAPSKPAMPTLVSVSSSHITVELDTLTIEDGGLPIEWFALEIKFDSEFIPVTTYVSGDSQHTLTVTDDALSGDCYIRWYATNSKAASHPSDQLFVLLADPPLAPETITKIQAKSDRTSISIEWTASPSVQEILGYVVTIEDIANGNSWPAFNGFELGLYDQRELTVYDLTVGQQYLFSVQAANLNGLGESSAKFAMNTCLPPSAAAKPTRVETTTSSIKVAWSAPADNGCPITEFAVMIDDGDSGPFVPVVDSLTEGNPGLN